MQTQIEVPVQAKGRRKMTNEEFVSEYVKGTLGTKRVQGNYHIGWQGELKYTAHGTDGGTEVLAVKVNNGLTIANANRLAYCGTTMAWGNRTRNWGQAPAQEWLEKAGAILVPFSVFERAKLDVVNIRITEKAPSETVKLRVLINRYGRESSEPQYEYRDRHYVGACLLAVGEEYFLFDIDRNEINNGIFNPFVVKLPSKADTIAQAYDMLKPEKVKQAEAEGLTVHRQGEWFFIKRMDKLPDALPKVDPEIFAAAKNAPHVLDFNGTPDSNYRAGMDTYYAKFTNDQDLERYVEAQKAWVKANEAVMSFEPRKGSLQVNGNRPNTVDKFIILNGVTLVSGVVMHTGREHAPLELGTDWYEAVPNTSVGSWQISGEID